MSPILLDLVADKRYFHRNGYYCRCRYRILNACAFNYYFLFIRKSCFKRRNKYQKRQTNKITKSEQSFLLRHLLKASAPAPQVEAGISGEVVAAIAAAVAVSEGKGAVVKSIRRVNVVNVRGRNPWANAAVYDNTRPF